MITQNCIKMCEKAKQLQKLWKPKVGDWVWRKYTVFGEEVDSQIWDKDKMEEIIILTYASDVDGYFQATKDGEERIFNSHNEMHKKTCIWLPTQEQLQEMVNEEEYSIDGFTYGFSHFCHYDEINGYSPQPSEIFSDYNELWLAFVMYEKWNKIWTGKDWIKET